MRNIVCKQIEFVHVIANFVFGEQNMMTISSKKYFRYIKFFEKSINSIVLWFTRLHQALTLLWFLTRMYNYIGVATESRQMVFSPSSRPTRFTTARTTPPAFSDASIVIEWTSIILSEYPTFISGLKKRCHIFEESSPFIAVKWTLGFVLLVLNLKF